MSKDAQYKHYTDNQQPMRSLANDNANCGQDDKKSLAKKGWIQKDSSFNKTQTDCSNSNTEVISRSINKLFKNEKKPRPTANPTKVCLKPEVLQESKEQFAQRIRQAWIDREQSKSCINIYLARNVVEDPLTAPAADRAQECTIPEEENERGRTALEVQLQNHAGDGENSPDDSSEDEKPLSAAARRVKFYKTAKQQNDRQHLTRAMSAPSSRQQSASSQGNFSTGSRRKSQEVHKFPTRKLKSCRSKAFHKSIDVDSRLPNGQKYGKKNQNVEVVTMMSLLSPVGSDAEPEEPAAPHSPHDISPKTVTFPQFNNNMRYHQKSFDSAMESIGKPKLLNNRVGKSLIKSRTIEITRDDEDDVQAVVKEVEISERRDAEIPGDGKIAIHYDVVDGQPMFKSDKEKECWALFKKMTAKGVSVTFDTVLRGMLTPTEYRLRKNELLLFG